MLSEWVFVDIFEYFQALLLYKKVDIAKLTELLPAYSFTAVLSYPDRHTKDTGSYSG